MLMTSPVFFLREIVRTTSKFGDFQIAWKILIDVFYGISLNSISIVRIKPCHKTDILKIHTFAEY